MDEHPHTAGVGGSGTKPGVPGARFASAEAQHSSGPSMPWGGTHGQGRLT